MWRTNALLVSAVFASALLLPVHSIDQRPRHRGSAALQQQERARPAGLSEAASKVTVKREYPFYHTTSELENEVHNLKENCHGAVSLDHESEDGVNIDVISIKKKGTTPINKVFFLFGEHSRELISPESGVELIRALCGGQGGGGLSQVLEDSEFQMILNGNPRSRVKVEEGDYCLRTNPSGVDLNRNWDEKWTNEDLPEAPAMTNPGPKPFSEPETRIFRRVVSKFNPTTFVTIHSGTRGMYMPWAFDMEHLAQFNQPQMLDVLRTLDKSYCQCPFGAAGKEVGYPCPGTCLDWVYDNLKTPYVFAFEIYTSPEQSRGLQSRWQDEVDNGATSLLQNGEHLGHEKFHELFSAHPSDFVSLSEKTAGARTDDRSESCFRQFNPTEEAEYKEVVQNWVSAYLDMSTLVAKKLQANASAVKA